MNKALTLLLILALVASSLIMLSSVCAQTIPKPSVPEFTLKIVEHSYDVPPTTESTTDPYTNKTTTFTIAGYHVDYKTIDATINNNGAFYYNFRYKPHYTDRWSYYPFNPEISTNYVVSSARDLSGMYNASTTDCTVISLGFLNRNLPEEGQIDVQIQGLIGTFEQNSYGMILTDEKGKHFPTYNFVFSGKMSDWSSTQTITIGATSTSVSPSPDPTVIPTPTMMITSTQDSASSPVQPNTELGVTLGKSLEQIVIIAMAAVIVALMLTLVLSRRKKR